jgi:L-alanine-DL-glutamate epimerase-like enolase superfamily enzyme
MRRTHVTDISVIGIGGAVRTGDDRHVVIVSAGDQHGSYGPVSERVARFISRRLAKTATGHAVRDHSGLLERLTNTVASSRPDVVSWAIGALDCAMWDLHGVVEGCSVAELLAGKPTRREIPAYASWLRLDISKPAAAPLITRAAMQGWLFTKWALRRRRPMSPSLEVSRLAQATIRATEAAGAPVAVDALGTWDHDFGRLFAAAGAAGLPRWLEDPLPDIGGHALWKDDGKPPLAIGETVCLTDDLGLILNNPALAVLTIDVVGSGGLTRAVDIITAAHVKGVPIYPHGRSLIPGIHLAAAFPDAVPAVEYRLQWEPRRQALYCEPIVAADGRLPLPVRPGLGVTVRSI